MTDTNNEPDETNIEMMLLDARIDSTDFYSCDNEWDDCNLSAEDFDELANVPTSVDLWRDVDQKESPSLLSFDDAKKTNWQMGKKEIQHLKKTIESTFNSNQDSPLSSKELNYSITLALLGAESNTGQFLCKELDLTKDQYLEFMCTFAIQAAYRVSITELYDNISLLKNSVPMSQANYSEIWRNIATKKEVAVDVMRTSRSATPLWQTLESIVNAEMKKYAIDDREGRIAISLDDDKIWFANKRAGKSDLFDLKYTTHTKANRKGAVAHTAVSTSLMIPLQIAFERTKDNASSCFVRILNNLFGASGTADLQNVDLHSDRGYMTRDIVDYLLENGANFTGTTKRLIGCWPFTYNQQINNPASDKRTLVDVKGAPTLFLKSCRAGAKSLFASAFRNGSQSVATAVSSLHRGHQWEGVVLCNAEHRAWLDDDSALQDKFFQSISFTNDDDGILVPSGDDEDLLNDLFSTAITPYTLRQGTACWHWCRKFSFTSSQAHQAFVKALPLHLDDNDWVAVAEYVYGHNWKQVLNIDVQEEQEEESENVEDNPITLPEYIANYEEDSVDDVDADDLRFAITWLISKTNPESVSESESAAKDEWRNQSFRQDRDRCIKVKIQNIILSFDPYRLERKDKITLADMSKWMHSPNSERAVMFYKSASLKEIMKRKKLKASSGTLNMARMIKAIAGTNLFGVVHDCPASDIPISSSLSERGEIIKAVLERSFLPHQKGEKRQHCSLGHRLELPILRKFAENLQTEREYRGIKMTSAYTAGLAAKKGKEYAKDSIDFVLCVKDPKADGEKKLWGFEAKGRVTVNTAESEQQNIALDANPHI